jgi:hypothetical protein
MLPLLAILATPCLEYLVVKVRQSQVTSLQKSSQDIVIRGSDWDPDAMHPWAHRVTHIMSGGVLEDTYPPYTGFRVVMDEWQRQQWPGFRVGEWQTEIPAQPAFMR